jgi:hypothetical protein
MMDSRLSLIKLIEHKGNTMAETVNGVRYRGPKIRVPPGDTVESLVRHGMCLPIKSAYKAAEQVGVPRDAFLFMRKLLMLKARDTLSAEETAAVDLAIEAVNQHRRLAPARTLVQEIVNRHWTPHTMRGSTHEGRKTTAKIKKQFDKTLFLIRETCTNNEEMRLPLLTSKEKDDAIKTLVESISGLSDLLNRVQKGGN